MPGVRRVALLVVVAAGCSGDDLLLPGEGQPVHVVAAGGDGQQGVVGQPLPEPIEVRVTDARERPVVGIRVSFVVVNAAGSAPSLAPESALTDEDGRARTEVTLGETTGEVTVEARVDELAAVFTLRAMPVPTPRLVLVTPPSSEARSGVRLERQPIIQLETAEGESIARADVAVTVQVASGGGTLAGTTTRTTSNAGRATFTDLALTGAPGSYTLIFAANGFSATTSSAIDLTAGEPASLAIDAGDDQTATVATEVATAPAVVVRDGHGSPVPDVVVTFAVASGGGSITGARATTNASGIATVGRWTLGERAGTNTLRASVGGDVDGSPVTFRATGTPGPAVASTTVAEVPERSCFGRTVPITVITRDAHGNDLTTGGAAVTVGVRIGGGSEVSRPVTDNDDGTYSAEVPVQFSDIAVHVRLDGTPIGGSPYEVDVRFLCGD